MLILNRLRGEKIRIGKDIVVTVLETRSGRVILGIDAPREMQILRDDAVYHGQRAAVRGEEKP